MKKKRNIWEFIISSLPFLALLTSIITYSFWGKFGNIYGADFGDKMFFVGNMVSINFLTFFIYLSDKNKKHYMNLVKLLLCETALLNLIKELFGDPSKLYKIEVIIATIVLFIWYFLNKKKK